MNEWYRRPTDRPTNVGSGGGNNDDDDDDNDGGNQQTNDADGNDNESQTTRYDDVTNVAQILQKSPKGAVGLEDDEKWTRRADGFWDGDVKKTTGETRNNSEISHASKSQFLSESNSLPTRRIITLRLARTAMAAAARAKVPSGTVGRIKRVSRRTHRGSFLR